MDSNKFNYLSTDLEYIVCYFGELINEHSDYPNSLFISKHGGEILIGSLIGLEKNKLYEDFLKTKIGKIVILLLLLKYKNLIKDKQSQQELNNLTREQHE